MLIADVGIGDWSGVGLLFLLPALMGVGLFFLGGVIALIVERWANGMKALYCRECGEAIPPVPGRCRCGFAHDRWGNVIDEPPVEVDPRRIDWTRFRERSAGQRPDGILSGPVPDRGSHD